MKLRSSWSKDGSRLVFECGCPYCGKVFSSQAGSAKLADMLQAVFDFAISLGEHMENHSQLRGMIDEARLNVRQEKAKKQTAARRSAKVKSNIG